MLNTTAPGDSCVNDTECFNGFNYTANCTASFCTTNATIGGVCNIDEGQMNGTKSCPVGAYCNGTECVDQLGEGTNCTAFDQCKTGYACLKVTYPEEAEAFTCQKYWTLDNGVQYDSSNMRSAGFVLRDIDACKSHHSITNDSTTNIYECRIAPKSPYTSESDLVRADGPVDDCNVTTYDDPVNATNATTTSDLAKCGFNKGGAAYCDKRKGDPWFQGALEKVQGAPVTDLECHAYSQLDQCGSAASKIGMPLLKEWVRELLAADPNFGYGLYADNDNCVGASITAEFWQGDSPSSAFGSLTLSSFAAMILTISALFYMF